MRNIALRCLLAGVVMGLLLCAPACAESILPPLDSVLGVPMPSLGEALRRYPDGETAGEDGSLTEVFRGVTEADYDAFGVYLGGHGAVLADYRAADGVFTASVWVSGRTFSFTYDRQTREASVTYPEGTRDAWLDTAKTGVETAERLLGEGKSGEALSVLRAIPEHERYSPAAALLRDSAALAEAARRSARTDAFRTPGNVVTFGAYPQGRTATVGTPIEWLVLAYDADGGRALLISRYALDAKPYNDEYTAVTWAECTLRSWLNGTFLNRAFTPAQQAGILLTDVDNGPDQGMDGWDTDGGADTQDRVFLLSYAEAHRYFGVIWDDINNTKARVAPTTYAVSRGAYTSQSGNLTEDGRAAGWWWLRSPGNRQSYAAGVDTVGALNYGNISYGSGSVRPAIWIDLNADIF